MAQTDPILSTAPIAGPHQSTVTAILRGVELGLFTVADADMMIERVRAHRTALPIMWPSSVADGVTDAIGGFA